MQERTDDVGEDHDLHELDIGRSDRTQDGSLIPEEDPGDDSDDRANQDPEREARGVT